MHNVLIVEDDVDLSEITKTYLTTEDYNVDCAYTFEEAINLTYKNSYDVILLDFLLPDGKGDEICSKIRKITNCPVIFISCLDDKETVLSSFSSGGDDYITKPIVFDELLARISAHIRRFDQMQKIHKKNNLTFSSFSIDTDKRCLLINKIPIDLSSIEYNLLIFFTKNEGKLLLYNDLYNHIWGSCSFGDTRTVMVHISNLRKKIDPNKVGIIQTVRSAGYIFNNL